MQPLTTMNEEDIVEEYIKAMKYVSEDEADEPNKRCIVEMYVWKYNFYISGVKYGRSCL